MYMPNTRILHLEPNATYIPPTRVGVLRWVTRILKFGLGLTQIFSGFRYQHVGIGNAKLWRWGSKPTPVPNANGFASQWNIGLRLCKALQMKKKYIGYIRLYKNFFFTFMLAIAVNQYTSPRLKS